MSDHDEVLQQVLRTFVGQAPRTRARAKPHRCLGCGKVTRHVFCPGTYRQCRALWKARQS